MSFELTAMFSVAGVVLTAVGMMYRSLQTLKTNHIEHVNEKLDAIQASVNKVDAKLDRHLDYHLTNKI